MTNYREILRLYSLGSSQRSIAREVQSSRDTVADVIKAAKAAGITWPLDDDVANEDIQEVFHNWNNLDWRCALHVHAVL